MCCSVLQCVAVWFEVDLIRLHSFLIQSDLCIVYFNYLVGILARFNFLWYMYKWVMAHMNGLWGTGECVMTRMSESWQIYEWVMAQMDESWHVYKKVVAHMDESWRTDEWVMAPMSMTMPATISRLLKIIGLLCKRALQKRLYSAKETCILRSLLIVATPSHMAITVPESWSCYISKWKKKRRWRSSVYPCSFWMSRGTRMSASRSILADFNWTGHGAILWYSPLRMP